MLDLLNSPHLLFLGTLLKMDKINNKYMILFMIIYLIINFVIESIDKQAIKDYIEKEVNKLIDIFFPNKKVSIELVTHTISHTIGYSDKIQKKKIYSADFISLLEYIKSLNISKKKEILTTQLKDTMWCNRHDENNSDDRYQFIPASDFYEDTLICKEHEIYLKMTNVTSSDDEENKNKLQNDLTAKIYMYYKKNNEKEKKIKILSDFLSKVRKIYIDKITKIDNKQYIYVYQKAEDYDGETKLIYSEHINQHNKTFNNVFIEDKQKLMNYISKFKHNVDDHIIKDYQKMGIPYKAGILFWGKPGTGKTSTIKAILKETNRHGIIINLSNIESNKELENVFRNRTINNKKYNGNQLCFILEDCDATKLSSLKERSEETKISIKPSNNDEKNLSSDIKNLISIQQKGFDLSCFLNILDGIIELYGVMIIVTTNHPEKIDEAIIRPGRIDFKYEFKNASKKIIIEMLIVKFDIHDSLFFEKYQNYFNEIDDYQISTAEIQTILSQNDCIEKCLSTIIDKIRIIKL